MHNVEQNAHICLFDVAHVILCGDDRFILCADDHLSASFASLYAIGQIAKQLIFVSITPQESIPVCRNRCSCNHALSLPSATVRSTIPCRLFQDVCEIRVPDNIYSADSFKPRGDIRKTHLLGIGLVLKCSTSPGLIICTIAAPSKTLASIPG